MRIQFSSFLARLLKNEPANMGVGENSDESSAGKRNAALGPRG
jgi:hypothetical protein